MFKNVLLSGWRTNTGVIALAVSAVLSLFGVVDQEIVNSVTAAAIGLIGYGIGNKIDKQQ